MLCCVRSSEFVEELSDDDFRNAKAACSLWSARVTQLQQAFIRSDCYAPILCIDSCWNELNSDG